MNHLDKFYLLRDKLKRELLLMRSTVLNEVDLTRIQCALSELTPPKYTPIHLLLTFYDRSKTLDEDENISLGISLQFYNPQSGEFVVYSDKLFLLMTFEDDFNARNASKVKEIPINILDNETEIKKLVDEVKDFLKIQCQKIIEEIG